ncbi:MAG: hypothetical protein M1833_006665 [Piccolia ochrophora]|nr:MAG: hypothetical protein M1833_006665 [Piccolia ochrophora]
MSIARNGFARNGFPTFCGSLIGGYAFLRIVFFQISARFSSGKFRSVAYLRRAGLLVEFLSALTAAALSFRLLNGPSPPPATEAGKANRKQRGFPTEDGEQRSRSVFEADRASAKPLLAGKSMDLTLFAAIRAADAVIGEVWTRRKTSRISTKRWTKLESLTGSAADAGLFSISSSLVMWSWIYLPDRLPRSYRKWIREAADVDGRLVEALRRLRNGSWIYGKDTGQAPLLQSMCEDYHWPLEWGDPAKTVPIPCEIVHMGTGASCEKHAAGRFIRAFKFAFATYLPLNLIVRIRSPSSSGFFRAFTESIRSSAFLSAFISLFYYSICLARTRLGPRIFDRKIVTPQMWDSGLCIGAGCAMCGWSILIEAERRRSEIALFVAPRAAATFFPRHYLQRHQWKEALVFSLSTATIFTFLREKPERVRGFLGRLLQQIVEDR